MSQADSSLNIQNIGEQGLLKLVQSFCPTNVVGDDAAVVTTQPGRSLIVTTDVLVDGVHFSDQTTAPEDAGWRAAAANLSDLAAMGAVPLGITVGLGLPGTTAVSWVEGLYRGLTACLNQYDTSIVGGDICRSPVISVAITAFGDVDPQQILRRSAARPGDAIVVTGPHGASRAGLELLLHPELGHSLSASDRAALITAHQRPTPRFDVVKWLSSPSRFPTFAAPIAIAAMDSSDGLADAVVQICRASGVGAQIARHCIPLPPALTRWVDPDRALEWALYGGEDFELVLCLPLDWATALVEALGEGAAIVGTITAEPGVRLVDLAGTHPDILLSLEQGFQHFGSPV